MSRGHNFSRCGVCLKEFVCGDCIVSVCPDCSEKLIKKLTMECPDGHGTVSVVMGGFHRMKLACGCVIMEAGLGGHGWIREKDSPRFGGKSRLED